MSKLLKLPVGIQAFETIRERGYVYVDKTRGIYRLIDEGMFYFLSRPRRFGKSLLISTLKCFFQGRKDLFEGLWIKQNLDGEWKEYPVVLIDFNEICHDTPENLKIDLSRCLSNIAQTFDVKLEEPLLKGQFKEVILSLYKKTGMPVVVLVDEYDKPIIDHLGKGEQAMEIAKANRDILKDFFAVLKGGIVSPLLNFVFITGVSKFSRVSIFSELNNLNDITMHDKYADLFGYTQDELEYYFAEYIQSFSKNIGESIEETMEKLAQYYNGYRFSKSKTRVYNPFSILKVFEQMDFKNYWFETGTPTFLVNLLQKTKFSLPKIENLITRESFFNTFDIENLRPEALLFQTGYITIKDLEGGIYILGYPNKEVRLSFLEILLHSYTQNFNSDENSLFILLSRYLQQEDFDSFFETVTAIFASIPYTLNTQRDEAYFHTLFYLMVTASCADVRNEVLTNKGRIDLTIEFPDKMFLLEFKCNQSAEAAITQIKEKGYAEKYRQNNKKLFLVGIDFSTEKRNVVDWKTETCKDELRGCTSVA